MPNFLMITGHDPRSKRKANIHFITEELARRGPARVFSLGFSALSRLRGKDPRLGLEKHANKVERKGALEMFLWRTPLHPINPRLRALQLLSPWTYRLYREAAPPVLKAWAQEATTIFVESGLGVLFIPKLRRWAPKATIIYVASDDLATIEVDPFLMGVFAASGREIDGIRLPSRRLVGSMPPGTDCFFVPHGIDRSLADDPSPSPFGPGRHAVSVGSMLFDPGFFHIAAELFPNVTFHVIGSGAPPSALPASVKVYPEMPFRETIPYLKHCDIGIAPYRNAKVPYYLCDTSMKLMQFDLLGRPAVCPTFVVADGHASRFGYEPDDASSIGAAIRAALAAKVETSRTFLSWSDVVDRLLEPARFSDTEIQHPVETAKPV